MKTNNTLTIKEKKNWSLDFLYRKYYNCSEISFYKARKNGVEFDKNIYVKKYKEIFELGMLKQFLIDLNHDCFKFEAKETKLKFNSYIKSKSKKFLLDGEVLKDNNLSALDLRKFVHFYQKKETMIESIKYEKARQEELQNKILKSVIAAFEKEVENSKPYSKYFLN